MREFGALLFQHTWWTWPQSPSWLDWGYHWFNILEGCAWLAFAALGLRRHWRWRHSQIEICYAAAFAVFAVTDFREAWAQQSWLIWIKLLNLTLLMWLRHVVMTRYYRGARLY